MQMLFCFLLCTLELAGSGPRPEPPIKPQEPSRELRVHLAQGSGRSSYAFVRAKFRPGEVEDPSVGRWAWSGEALGLAIP